MLLAPDHACNTTRGQVPWTVWDGKCAPTSTVVGYMGGTGMYPNYENYTTANNYSETVRLEFDPTAVSMDALLAFYWKSVPDPTVKSPDPAYQNRMFYVDDAQRVAMQASLAAQQKKLGATIPLEIVPAASYHFWKAEEYHQNYMRKQGMHCGGDGAEGLRRTPGSRRR